MNFEILKALLFQSKEMQEIVTLACEKWAAGDKVSNKPLLPRHQDCLPVPVAASQRPRQ